MRGGRNDIPPDQLGDASPTAEERRGPLPAPLLTWCNALWDSRTAVNAQLDEIARYAAPDRAGFGGMGPSPGDDGRQKIWDSTPEDAALTLAAALHGMLTNPATEWLSLELDGDADRDDAEISAFMESAQAAVTAALASHEGGFHQEVNQFYLDLACFGWAVFLVEDRGNRPCFRAINPSQCALDENAGGRVDSVLRRWNMSPAALVEEFGKDAVSEKVRNAVENGTAPGARVGVSHLVCPLSRLPESVRSDVARNRGGKAEKPFASLYYETEGGHCLSRGGFDELPYMCPRWSKRSGETYGRGPGHVCLPDMRVLNRVAQAQLVGAEKLADPPLLAADDSVVGRIRSGAGGITYVRPDALQQGRGLMQLPVDFRLDVAEAVLEKRRGAVRGAFLNDRIQMAGGPQMTATEVMARERKQNLVLGPVLGRLESEFLGPLTDRVFMLLLRAGAFAVPPGLAGRELRARYVSPLARAQRQSAAEAFGLALQYLAGFTQADPTIMDNFDFNSAARDSRELFGYPRKYLLDERKVQKNRQARAQQAQTAALARMAEQAGPALASAATEQEEGR